jgi:hypothetical protein
MKKLFSVALSLILFSALSSVAFAEKPFDFLTGARKVRWNLSRAVMPVPPYGSIDIPGSDKASKLTINQPNCKADIKIDGIMKNLNPETTYTVYLSNGYKPYKEKGWDVSGSYVFNFIWKDIGYPNDVTLTQTGDKITGTIGWPSNQHPYSVEGTVTGTIHGNKLILYIDYNDRDNLRTVTATINTEGNISGTWLDANADFGDLTTTGAAVKKHTGDTGWPGLFTNTVEPFTFTTNKSGDGKWNINLGNSNFPEPGTYTLSIWINGDGATLLISNSFKVTAPSLDKQCMKYNHDRHIDHDGFDLDGNDDDGYYINDHPLGHNR